LISPRGRDLAGPAPNGSLRNEKQVLRIVESGPPRRLSQLQTGACKVVRSRRSGACQDGNQIGGRGPVISRIPQALLQTALNHKNCSTKLSNKGDGPPRRTNDIKPHDGPLIAYVSARIGTTIRFSAARRRRIRQLRNKENRYSQKTLQLERVFDTWRSYTRRAQVRTLRKLLACYHFETVVVQKCFSLWKLLLVKKSWLRACEHERRKTLEKLFDAWRGSRQLTAKYWMLWKLRAEHKRFGNKALQARKRAALAKLSRFAVGRRRTRSIGQQLEDSVRQTHINIAWQAWHAARLENEQVAILQQHLARAQAARALQQWNRTVRVEARRKASQARIVRQYLRDWSWTVRRRSALRRVTLVYSRNAEMQSMALKSHKFGLWKSKAMQSRLSEQLEQVKAALESVKITIQLDRARRLDQLVQRNAQRHAIQKWKGRCKAMENAYAQLENVGKLQGLKSAFANWNAYVKRARRHEMWATLFTALLSKDQERTAAGTCLIYRSQLLCKRSHFEAWRAFTIAGYLGNTKRLAYTWERLSLMCAKRRVRNRIATAFAQSRTRRRCFFLWVDFHELHQTKELVEAFYKRGLLQRMWSQWRHQVDLALRAWAQVRLEERAMQHSWTSFLRRELRE